MMGPDIFLYLLQEAITAENNIRYLLAIEICVMNNFLSLRYGELSHRGVVYFVYIFSPWIRPVWHDRGPGVCEIVAIWQRLEMKALE